MRPFFNWYSRISVFSALVAIYIQGFVLRYLASSPTSTESNLLVMLMSATLAYVLIYRLLIRSYEVFGWKIFLRKYNISGKWYHELISAQDPNYKRLGSTMINQSVFNIDLTAVNYNKDFNRAFRTIWNTKAITVDESGRIVLTYEAVRAVGNEQDSVFTKEGIMYAQIEYDEKGKPNRIVGEFMDSFPSTKRGAITWMRSVDWKDRLEKMLL